mmetsp:Transcript_112344/g.313944  ORF Transcript_112344/g.313944 Transcript_112344/m.313944 type:complete len:277 (-) Transcript_112344:449-1279(-)
MLRAAADHGLDLGPGDGHPATPERGGDLAHDHRGVLRERDEHDRVLAVQVVAEADLVAEADVDRGDFQAQVLGIWLAVLHEDSRLPALLRVLVPQAVVDGIVHGGEEPLLADELLEARLAHRFVDAIPGHCERDLDPAAPEVVHDVVDDVACGGVHGDHRRHLQHEVLRRVHLLQVGDIGQQHVLDERRVREVQGRSDPADEDVRNEGAAALLLHIAVNRRARNAPQDGELGAHGFVDDDDQRERHGDDDAHEHAQEQGAEEGDDPEEEVMALDAP